MRKILSYQNNFTKGELDPSLWGHTELPAYYEALARAENVWITSTGSAAKRYGLKKVARYEHKTSKMFRFSNISGTHYLLVVLPGKVEIIDVDTNDVVSEIDVDEFTDDTVQDVYASSYQDSVIFTHNSFAPKQLKWISGDDFTMSTIEFSNIPSFEFSVDDVTPSGTLTPSDSSGFITLTSSVDAFYSDDVGKYISMLPVGRLRITTYTSARVVGGYLEENMFDNNAVSSGDWTIERGWMPLWGDDGYPGVSGFHEGRLLLGNFPKARSVLAYSVINSPFDFSIGDTSTAYGGWKILSYDQRNVIRHITSEHELYIFCEHGEFLIDQSDGSNLRNAIIRHDTAIGTVDTISPVMSDDGGLYFFQNNSRGISEFRYYFDRGSYSTPKISKYAGHIIDLPISSAMWQGDDEFEVNILFFVNCDGSMVCATINLDEKILGFTRVVSHLLFSGVCSVNNTMYATAVDDDGTTLYMFEKGRYDDDGVAYESCIQTLPISSTEATLCMYDISVTNVHAYISDTRYLQVDDVVLYNGESITRKVRKYYSCGYGRDGMITLSDGSGDAHWQVNNVCREALIGGNV